MAEAISIQVSPEAERLLKRFQRLPARMLEAIAKEHDRQNQFTIARIREMHLSGGGPDNLNVRTGRLRKSIRATRATVITGDAVYSAIGSNVVYAGIHEFGGQTKPHIIKAKNGKALAFVGASGGAGPGDYRGSVVFRRQVKHPGSKIRARSYIRRSFEERKEEIGHALSMAIIGAWNEGGNQ